jgi:hypothetical protein
MQGLQCLLEAGHGLRAGRAGESLVAGVPQIRERLLPQLTPKRMVSQALDLPVQPIGAERLDGFHDPGMECTPPV